MPSNFGLLPRATIVQLRRTAKHQGADYGYGYSDSPRNGGGGEYGGAWSSAPSHGIDEYG